MIVETIFSNAQTYLGVLATLVVLCIFISENDAGSNFIIYTILKVGEDFKKHLKIGVDEINDEIKKLSEEKKSDSILGESPDTESLPEDIKKELNANTRNTMMISQRFVRDARRHYDRFQPGELHKKEELPFIALLNLFLIITVMLTDCLGFIPINTRCMFINLLLVVSSIFTLILYHKFLYDGNNNLKPDSKYTRPARVAFMTGFILSLLAWFLLSPFICAPAMSVISFCAIQLIGGYFIKGKWIRLCHAHDRYSRLMIIKHYLFFVGYLSFVIAAIYCWKLMMPLLGFSEMHVDNWNATVSLMESLTFCYYFTLAFFSINILFGPIFAGFIYLDRQERLIMNVIRSRKEKIRPTIARFTDEYFHILLRSQPK